MPEPNWAGRDTSTAGGGGGEIADPITLTPTDPTDVPLAFRPPAGATSNATDQIEIYNDTGTMLGYWDAQGNFQASTGGPNYISIDLSKIWLHMGNQSVQVNTSAATGVQLVSGGLIMLHSTGGTVALQGNTAVEMRDTSGVAIFRLTPDGQLHLKTGKTVLYDL